MPGDEADDKGVNAKVPWGVKSGNRAWGSGVRGAYCAVCAQSCLTLCDPMDCSLPGSSVRGILQAGILERVAMPSSRRSSNPGIKPVSPASPVLQGIFYHQATGKGYPRHPLLHCRRRGPCRSVSH